MPGDIKIKTERKGNRISSIITTKLDVPRIGFYRRIKHKQTPEYLSIRISVLFPKVIFLFLCDMNNLCVRIIKFVSTIVTSIFWYLSFSNRDLSTFTFWTHCNKILSNLNVFIMRSFNNSIFFFCQNSNTDFDIFSILIKKSVWEVFNT
jgi:hypothetical protein